MTDDRLNRGFASAAKYCAFTERAPKQVFDKLISWDFSEEQSKKIILRLIEENFLNEERFARAFCNDKFEFNRWGKVKIKMELGKFNLSYEVLTLALESINPEKYQKVIAELTNKKWQNLVGKGDDYLQKRKAANYMMQKGFEGELVWKELNKL
ncbi:MAG: RecX family transcriptional regulator [Cyclobacteriaceae bacterium]